MEFKAKLVAMIRTLAAESPNFVYTLTSEGFPCQYFPTEGNPEGCIIGAAMRRIGYELDGPTFANMAAPAAIENRTGKTLSEKTLKWLSIVQWKQDKGFSWSDAVADADRLISL